MRFEERELKPSAEPVPASELEPGAVYFSVTFVDEEMMIPVMETVVFVGRDLEPGDVGQLYFQDADSYQRGIQYGSVSEDEQATFYIGPENEMGHIFEYESALDILMMCSLRRRGLLPAE
jgi:hypothetical protein